MKRYISILTIWTLAALSTWAAEPVNKQQGCENWENFIHNIECYGRIGYAIGGTAPLGMPATIRGLNKFQLQPNVSFGADAIKPVNSRWGILAGIHFENKGMHIDAQVKNYHMQITQGGQTLEGMFTGKNDSHAVQWMFTLPLQGVYRFSDKCKLKFGPYFSYLTDRRFEGFAYDGYLRVDNPTGDKVLLGTAEDERGDYDFRDDIRPLQWGLDLGVDYFFARRIGIYADLAWGMSGFFKNSFKTLDQTLYPIYGIVGITYKFR